MTNIKDLKKGSVLSELSFYTVESINASKKEVGLLNDFGEKITVDYGYVEKLMSSADSYTSQEEKTVTELGEILKANPNIAMTVCFIPQEKKKTEKEFKAEVEQWTENAKQAFLNEGLKGLAKFADKPVERVIIPQPRVMKGRHYGSYETSGRLNFIDMEEKNDTSKAYDTRSRQVDPRTLQYIIVKGVKYIKKK